MKTGDMLLLLVLSILFGASFLFIKVASPVLGPLVLADLRVIGAALFLFPAVLWFRSLPIIMKHAKLFLRLGAVNAAIPFALIAYSSIHLNASMTAVLNATTPLFAAFIACIYKQEKFSVMMILGLTTGFSGVVLLMGWSQFEMGWLTISALSASLLASFCYSIGSVYAKNISTKFQISTTNLAVGQNAGAGIVLLLPALFTRPAAFPDMHVIGAVFGLAVFSTGIGYLLYFKLIKSVGATKTVSVTFLAPVFGILFGSVFLHETLNVESGIGISLIFLSIIVVTRQR